MKFASHNLEAGRPPGLYSSISKSAELRFSLPKYYSEIYKSQLPQINSLFNSQ